MIIYCKAIKKEKIQLFKSQFISIKIDTGWEKLKSIDALFYVESCTSKHEIYNGFFRIFKQSK